jgi:hypothetical protein
VEHELTLETAPENNTLNHTVNGTKNGSKSQENSKMVGIIARVKELREKGMSLQAASEVSLRISFC